MHRGMTEVVMWEILSSTCFMIPVVILFLALALPLNLKFGSEKGRSLFSGMMLAFFFLGIIGVKKLKGSLLLEQIQTLLQAKGLLLVTAGILTRQCVPFPETVYRFGWNFAFFCCLYQFPGAFAGDCVRIRCDQF